MKNKTIFSKLLISACVMTGITMTSCDDFLDITPRDQKVVSTVEDYRDVMASFMYYLKTPDMPRQENVFGVDAYTVPFVTTVHGNLGIYTGETNINNNSSIYFDRTHGEYTLTGKNIQSWLMTNDEAWRQYYAFLGPINLIINEIDGATGNNEDIRHYVKGEALIWRAYAYFKLLQYYSPYKNNDLGVPVYLTPQLEIGTAMPPRDTQRTVFTRIIDDCNEALDLLELTNSNEWNFLWTRKNITAFLATVYTWKAMSGAADTDDWENAGKYASEAMQGRHLASSPAVLRQMFDCSAQAYLSAFNNDEAFVRLMDGEYSTVCDMYEAYLEGNVSDGRISRVYASMFGDDDIRTSVWLRDKTYNNKYNLMGENGRCRGCLVPFRLAEMYLIKAEACCRQGKIGDATTVMNDFYASRYTSPRQVPADAASLLSAIIDERTREFYHEGDFRWLDMKRLGVELERTVAGERLKLTSDDFRYNFPIPAREMKLNKNMVQNPGWESIIIF